MASAALIDDRLQIDGFNAYTWTNTFGVSTGGFYKEPMDQGYTSQICEYETVYDGPMEVFHLPASMVLKTGVQYPAPSVLYPARKYQFDDGEVSYMRPGEAFIARDEEDKKNMWRIGFAFSAVLFIYLFRKQFHM
jgi:hypothetical protein